MNMLETLSNMIIEIEKVGNDLNKVKSDLRNKEFELKTLKLNIEFGDEFEEERDGLKVKEIPKLINDLTLKECQEIIDLKEKRDELDLQLTLLKMRFQVTQEVFEAQK